MTGDRWPAWDELRAKDKAAGRIDEVEVAEQRRRIWAARNEARFWFPPNWVRKPRHPAPPAR